ncbi:MAG: efflux RND transporter periplasmic adaptor subunit [Patescibacteria group bacterium]
MNIKMKKIAWLSLLFGVTLSLSACGSKTAEPAAPPAPIEVKAQTVSQSLSVKQTLSYPALVVADSEATIVAKAGGNLTAARFQVGDTVTLGQELAKIDDVNSADFNANNFNTNQIKQAKIAVSQAASAYELAKTNYNSSLLSSVKDLRSAEIARDQAAKNQSNLDITTAEALKSAQLAYETAQLATAAASSTLVNREKLAAQSAKDTATNADLAADSAASTAGTILTNINNFAAFDDKNNSNSVGYRASLGVLAPGSYDTAKAAYAAAKDAYTGYTAETFNDVNDQVAAAGRLAEQIKKLADDTKYLLDKSVPSSSLPLNAATGLSLSGLQAAAAGYQTQAAAALNQVNSASQALVNVSLNNATLLDSLRQALQIAQQQEASAKQNLANLQSGNTSQQNQAGFAASLAQNQYDNAKVKIEAQISAARTQLESTQLQYNNAVVALQSLYDAHSVIAPLDGTITKVFIADGQAVSAGQPIATVSQIKNLKVQFYVEAENLSEIKAGLPVQVADNNSQNYNGVIAAVSPQADSVSKRFLAEVKVADPAGLLLGTVVTVNLDITRQAGRSGLVILPLSSVTVGQNGSSIFINDNGRAKKITVTVQEVIGELAQVQVDLPSDALIITDGNRLLTDGEAISVKP